MTGWLGWFIEITAPGLSQAYVTDHTSRLLLELIRGKQVKWKQITQASNKRGRSEYFLTRRKREKSERAKRGQIYFLSIKGVRTFYRI